MTARQIHIYNYLIKDAAINGVDLVAEYCSKYQRSERTFWTDWKAAKDTFDKNNTAVQNKVSERVEKDMLESIEKALVTKQSRMDALRELLSVGTYEESVLDFKTGKVIRYHRKLNVMEIRGLHAELSKMAGEYAPTKIASTDPEGNAVPSIFEQMIKHGAKLE